MVVEVWILIFPVLLRLTVRNSDVIEPDQDFLEGKIGKIRKKVVQTDLDFFQTPQLHYQKPSV